MRFQPRKQPETGLYAPVWKEFNRFLDYVREITPQHGRGIKTTRKPSGTTIEVDLEPVQAGSVVNQYRIKEMFGDFYRCRLLNGATESASDVFIAKPWRLRRTPFDGETVIYSDDDDPYTASYVYSSNTKRASTVNAVVEQQVVVPGWKMNYDIIYAVEVKESLGLTDINDDAITLIDINADGRAWARARVQ